MRGTPDIAQLRNLLFGKDYDALLALKTQFEHSDQYSASVASVIAEALQLRESQDGAVSAALAPTVEQALTHAISTNPKRFADVLYPVMGPAIRKSIQQALNEALATFNQLLEQSLSLRSWHWRFDAWRTGQSYAQIALLRTLVYRVEQVFLIHRESGLLLQHVVSDNVASKDPEIVSGMLTAIQDFIQDSFAIEGNDMLDTLRLGELSVLVEHGPHAIIALVVRGSVPGELHALLAETSETIHQQYAQQLQAYHGNTTIFAGVEPLLAKCLIHKQKFQEKRPPWLAYTLLAIIAGALSWWAYQHHQQQVQLAQQEARAKLAQQQTLQTLASQLQQQQTRQAALQASLQTLLEQQSQQAAQQAQQAAAHARTIATLTRQIETAAYVFETAKALPDPGNPAFVTLRKQIQELLQTAKLSNQTPQIMIIGNTDASGTETTNQPLAQQRADNLRDALIKAGVPAAVLVAYGSGQAGMQQNERSTRYRVSLY